MSNISALQSGLNGIHTGMQRLNKNAADIASATNPQSNVNLTESIVELNANKQQVEASAKVVSANSEIIGSLLDIKV